MLSDIVEVLDRQIAFMLRQGDIDVFRHLPRYLERIAHDPRVASEIDALVSEAIEIITNLNGERHAIADSLVKLREQFVVAHPDEDDRTTRYDEPIDDDDRPSHRKKRPGFDELIKQTRLLWPDVRKASTDDALGEAIKILKDWVGHVADTDEEMFPLLRAVNTERERLQDVQRRYELKCFASPAVAAVRIRGRSAALTPPPKIFDTALKLQEMLRYVLSDMHSYELLMRRHVYGQARKDDEKRFRELATELRADLELLHEELRARLGLTRSLVALVNRYKHRAETYDATELRDMAARVRGGEDELTALLARYLHDHGLNPLIQPTITNLRPDLLDPVSKWTFYLEAKQYGGKRTPRAAVFEGMKQVWSTLGRLRGTAFEVREAFLVVFRLGGRRAALPSFVRSEGSVVHLILIDLAPAAESGSREREQPVKFTEDQLCAVTLEHADVPRKPAAKKKAKEPKQPKQPAKKAKRPVGAAPALQASNSTMTGA